MELTAVEWLFEEITGLKVKSNFELFKKDLEKAKAMEKEQIIDFAKQWEARQNDGNLDTIEMLYEETYNK